MINFNSLYKIIMEDNASGAGGVFGSGESFNHGGDIGNDDFWNRDDARIPYVMGYFSRNGMLKPKSKVKKTKSKNKRNRRKKKK
jgi:hypothetical protein